MEMTVYVTDTRTKEVMTYHSQTIEEGVKFANYYRRKYGYLVKTEKWK